MLKQQSSKRSLARLQKEGNPMKILVCDDESSVVQQISAIIDAYCASNGSKALILKATDPSKVDLADEFDVAFLDVDMPQMSGIDLAQKIHARWPNSILVFVTNYVQYAPDGYEVGAFRYLMKNKIPEKLPLYLELAIKERIKRVRTITIQINGEHIPVPVSNILYMESNARVVTMHLIDDLRTRYQFYGNLSDLEQKFEILGFLRVHKSYLVNMAYIELFQCKKLTLTGAVEIPSSERKYSELKQQYLKWEAENKWNIY